MIDDEKSVGGSKFGIIYKREEDEIVKRRRGEREEKEKEKRRRKREGGFFMAFPDPPSTPSRSGQESIIHPITTTG